MRFLGEFALNPWTCTCTRTRLMRNQKEIRGFSRFKAWSLGQRQTAEFFIRFDVKERHGNFFSVKSLKMNDVK